MDKICRLFLEKEGVTTIKSFKYSDLEYTITTIIVDPNTIYIPTVETKNFEEGIYPLKELLDQGYKYINPYDDEIEIKYLSPKIISQLKRIGLDENEYFNPYERDEVETTLGKRILPTAINQFESFNWHESDKNEFKTTIGNDKINNINFGIGGDLSQYSNHKFEGAYYMVGHYDGGNYYLLFDLDDENHSNPMVYKMDHDPYDEEFPVYSMNCRLSEFVSKMKIDKSR
jgi:hypothetical protein